MKSGYLSQYFKGVAIKTLSSVEVDLFKSNQHEFNGIGELKKMFGKAEGKKNFDAKFIYLTDNDDEPVISDAFLTWYDARENHPKRSEHRLYFPTTTVSTCAAVGDLLVIGLRPDNSVLVIIAENGSTISNQIKWLFGFQGLHPGFSVRGELESEQDRIAFTSNIILEQLGIEIVIDNINYLDEMIRKFDSRLPSTKVFSSYARSTLSDINPNDDEDGALVAWLEREEILFRTFEKYLVAERLSKGFENDIDGFIEFSLSVQNRRKSRVGQAFENHVEELFAKCDVMYSRTKITENKSRPDFIMPSIQMYHNHDFDVSYLTMLGVKTTCKDRWRQILAEADRIDNKHLLTMEPAISESQTNEMKERKLQLIVPKNYHHTYNDVQQNWLYDVKYFIKEVKDKQDTSRVNFLLSNKTGFIV